MSPSDVEGATQADGRYFIRKASRASARPYDGPSLAAAGLTSRWYAERDDALADARRLAEVNRVGWVVARESESPSGMLRPTLG